MPELEVRHPGAHYRVVVEIGVFSRAKDLVAALSPSGVFLVSESTLLKLTGGELIHGLEETGIRFATHLISGGEQCKSLDTVAELYQGLAAFGADREVVILALGGGVIGDLAGFAAATWLRGVRWVVFPTTLLAQVDSSIGGKVGVDLPAGKNLVGAFHSPELVLCDPLILSSLPTPVWRQGMAEVVKSALIGDAGLLAMVEKCAAELALPPPGGMSSSLPLEKMVLAAAAVKVAVVNRDPFEAETRAVLNLGHTVGHALETATGYSGLGHGDAVALGMVAAVHLAGGLGMLEDDLERRLPALLEKLGLPTCPPPVDRSTFRSALLQDKKRRRGHLRMVLPRAAGRVVVVEVEPEQVESTLELMGGFRPLAGPAAGRVDNS